MPSPATDPIRAERVDLLVLTAMPLEARGLARRLDLRRVAGSRWPHYRGGRIELAAVGLGATRLAERAGRLGAPDLVVSSGLCGALASGLATGDLVVPARVVGSGRTYVTAPLPPLTSGGTLVTSPSVVATPSDKWRLRAATGAAAVDLESVAILEWARTIGAAAGVVRGVSDTADMPVPEELLTLVTPEGTIPARAALMAMARRPALWRRVVALMRGTAAALDAVGRALRAVADVRAGASRDAAHAQAGTAAPTAASEPQVAACEAPSQHAADVPPPLRPDVPRGRAGES